MEVLRGMSYKVLIIIPAYNEEDAIGRVIDKIRLVSNAVDIVVINDGSKDMTSETARSKGVIVIDLPHNLGIGGAMQTGYIYAARNNYDIAIQIDADGQHDPNDLENIIDPILRNEANLVIGSRYVKKTSYKSSYMRRIGMILFSNTLTLVTGQRFTDTTSGYRAADRKVILMYSEYYPTDYPEVEVILMLKKANLKIQEVSVVMEERQAGRSSITPIKSAYYMVKVFLALFINILRPRVNGGIRNEH